MSERYRMTITIEVPYEATRRKNMRSAGATMIRASEGAQSGADVLLGVLGLALMDVDAREYAIACDFIPEDVQPFIPEGVCVKVEEVDAT